MMDGKRIMNQALTIFLEKNLAMYTQSFQDTTNSDLVLLIKRNGSVSFVYLFNTLSSSVWFC